MTAELAAAIGITRPYCTRLLCPSGTKTRPGPQVRAALQAWLDARSGPGNGAAEPDVEFAPETLDPHRLTVVQRERLTAILQLDKASLRAAGFNVDLAERAIVGERLEPALAERLVTFLG